MLISIFIVLSLSVVVYIAIEQLLWMNELLNDKENNNNDR